MGYRSLVILLLALLCIDLTYGQGYLAKKELPLLSLFDANATQVLWNLTGDMIKDAENIHRGLQAIREDHMDSAAYEIGYMNYEIIELYRKMVDKYNSSVTYLKNLYPYEHLLYLEEIEHHFFELEHFTNMLHEIERKYNIYERKSTISFSMPTAKTFRTKRYSFSGPRTTTSRVSRFKGWKYGASVAAEVNEATKKGSDTKGSNAKSSDSKNADTKGGETNSNDGTAAGDNKSNSSPKTGQGEGSNGKNNNQGTGTENDGSNKKGHKNKPKKGKKGKSAKSKKGQGKKKKSGQSGQQGDEDHDSDEDEDEDEKGAEKGEGRVNSGRPAYGPLASTRGPVMKSPWPIDYGVKTFASWNIPQDLEQIIDELSWSTRLKLLNEFSEPTPSNIPHPRRRAGTKSYQFPDFRRQTAPETLKPDLRPLLIKPTPSTLNDDSSMKLKLFRLMYETVSDSDLKVKRAELIRSHYMNNTIFEIGYLMGDVTDKYNVMTDISMTLKRLYDDWKPIEHINAYEQIANQAIELGHVIDIMKTVYKKGNPPPMPL